MTWLPRPLHVYVVGTAKSGTMSLAHMLKACYRAAHEPGASILLSWLAGEGQKASREETHRFLHTRDRALRLAVEANQLLCPLAVDLADVFPRALFIHPVRDCYSFLESLVNHRLTRPRGVWAQYDRSPSARHEVDYAPEEAFLRDRSLPPVSNMFAHWARQNEVVLDRVPAARLLSIRTPDIDAAAGRIADFLGIPVEHVDRGRSRRNVADRRPFQLSLIDGDFLAARAQEHCAPLMRRFFPEIEHPPGQRAASP